MTCAYLFSYGVGHAGYILLDASSYYYPYVSYNTFASEARLIIQRGAYGMVDMDDGYLLLKKGSQPRNVTQALQMITKHAHGYS